jgi:hypothetical protein
MQLPAPLCEFGTPLCEFGTATDSFVNKNTGLQDPYILTPYMKLSYMAPCGFVDALRAPPSSTGTATTAVIFSLGGTRHYCIGGCEG